MKHTAPYDENDGRSCSTQRQTCACTCVKLMCTLLIRYCDKYCSRKYYT